MRIKSIEYENFRNFMERGKIECSTDGKVTIIYGRNGDGKTTLHQLFQWIFYGQVHFNKTATNNLYNLKFESKAKVGDEFEVMGRVNFVHAGKEYTLRRTAYFMKDYDGTRQTTEELELQQKDSDNNWRHIDKPDEMIEQLLPSGLAEYFFFDGESMIADLSMKGADSANKLRTALYSMFDLDVLDMALDHIGSIDLKKTVLGKLYLNKGDVSNGSQGAIVKENIEQAQGRIEKYNAKYSTSKTERDEKKHTIKEISERIGSQKSKGDYERQRKQYIATRETAKKNAEQAKSDFGDSIMDVYPKLLISKDILEASDVLKLKINSTSLPLGLGKTLINYLLSQDNADGKCICGNPLCENEREHIRAFLDLLPPKSYTNIYQEFVNRAKNWGAGYNKEKLENYIQLVLKNDELVDQADEAIRVLDNEQKKSADIEELVKAREKAETRVAELDEDITNIEVELKKLKLYLKKQMSDYDKITKDDQKTQEAEHRIRIMQSVGDYFAKRLKSASDSYSQKLEENIQFLLNNMMDNERKVSVSPDFAVKVFDSFGDESKSEGQFAITSFAYIGGIFKMLKSEDRLAEKEYPLVLDGPFSKLDPTRIQSVVDTIPQFAPQIILFSKDSLQEVFSPEQLGRVWTITSNTEQNVAKIKEGYLWN